MNCDLDKAMIVSAPPLKSRPCGTSKVQYLDDISPIKESLPSHSSQNKKFASVKHKLVYFLHGNNSLAKDWKYNVNESDIFWTFECDKLVDRFLLCKHGKKILQQLYRNSSAQKITILMRSMNDAKAKVEIFKRMKIRVKMMVKLIISNHVIESKFLKHCWAFVSQNLFHLRVRLCVELQAMRDATSYLICKEGSLLFGLLKKKIKERRRERGTGQIYFRIRKLREAILTLRLFATLIRLRNREGNALKICNILNKRKKKSNNEFNISYSQKSFAFCRTYIECVTDRIKGQKHHCLRLSYGGFVKLRKHFTQIQRKGDLQLMWRSTIFVLLMRRAVREWCGKVIQGVKKRNMLHYSADFNDTWILTQAFMRWRKRWQFSTSIFQRNLNMVQSRKKGSIQMNTEVGLGLRYLGSLNRAVATHHQKHIVRHSISIWRDYYSLNLSQNSAVAISKNYLMQKIWNGLVCIVAVLKKSSIKRKLLTLRNHGFTNKVGLLKGWGVLSASWLRQKTIRLKKRTAELVRCTSLLKSAFKGLLLNYTEGKMLLQQGRLQSIAFMTGQAMSILLCRMVTLKSRREKVFLVELKVSKGKLRRCLQHIMQILLASGNESEKLKGKDSNKWNRLSSRRESETAHLAVTAIQSEKARFLHNLRCLQEGPLNLKGNALENEHLRQQVEKVSMRHDFIRLQQTFIVFVGQIQSIIHQKEVSNNVVLQALFIKKQIYFKRFLTYYLAQVRIKRGRRASLQRFCSLSFHQWIHYARLKPLVTLKGQLSSGGIRDGSGRKEQHGIACMAGTAYSSLDSLRSMFKISHQHLNCIKAQRWHQLRRIKASMISFDILRLNRKAVQVALKDIILEDLSKSFLTLWGYNQRRKEGLTAYRAKEIVRDGNMLAKALLKLKYHKRLRCAYRAVHANIKRGAYTFWAKRVGSRCNAKVQIIKCITDVIARKTSNCFKEWVINTHVENLLLLAIKGNYGVKKNTYFVRWVSFAMQNKRLYTLKKRAHSMHLESLTRIVYTALLQKIERRYKNKDKMKLFYKSYTNYLSRHVLYSLLFLRKNRIALRLYLKKSFISVVQQLRYNGFLYKTAITSMAKGERVISRKFLLRWKVRLIGKEKLLSVREKKSWETLAARQAKINLVHVWRRKCVLMQAINRFRSFISLSIHSFKNLEDVQLCQTNRLLHSVFTSLLHLLRQRHILNRETSRFRQCTHTTLLKKTFHKLDIYCSVRWARDQRSRIVRMHNKMMTLARGFRKLMNTCCKCIKGSKVVNSERTRIRNS